jgi:hypothetical protein
MKYLIVIFSLVLTYVEGDRYLNASGPFSRRHLIDDEPRPHVYDRHHGISSLSRISAVTNIYVSFTTSSSNELITITWLPDISADDFISIYMLLKLLFSKLMIHNFRDFLFIYFV